tara:strand:- start:120 stop:350 length:231 start_codon:yes stop_codon:yes gene_type:complete
MLDEIINSSLETIFPKNEKKKIIDFKKDLGYLLLQYFIIDNKINHQSKNIKGQFLFKNVFKEIKKVTTIVIITLSI